MRRSSTQHARVAPLKIASPGTRPGGTPERKPARITTADSPSRLVVLPVEIARGGYDPRSFGPGREVTAIRMCEPVHISGVTHDLLCAKRADVVLLDARSVRAAVVYRSIVRLRNAGCRSGIMLLIDARDLGIVPVSASLGAGDFILSTATSEEVATRLRRQAPTAHSGSRERSSRAEGAGIELHWRTHAVSHGDIRIALTLREMQLLDALLERAGEVITAADLAASAWGKSRSGSGGLTTAYVCSLRKKLAWFGGRFGIRTVRGVGYRFVV
jgi:DNA-binding response OmpR family regulator